MAKTVTLTDRRGRKAAVEPGSPAEAHFRAHGFTEARRRQAPAKAKRTAKQAAKRGA